MPAQLKPSAFRVKHPSKLFYGTQMSYIFLRLHHTLYMRLKLARTLSQEMQDEYRSRGVSSPAMRNTKVLLAHLDAIDTEGNIIDGADKSSLPVYNHFLGQVYSLVEGTIDNSKFEEFCRVLLGNKSYVLFTLDKLVSMAIKHLQAMANDENVSRLVGLFVYHHNNGLSNGTPLTTNNNTASANGRPVLKSSSKDSDKNSKSASANAKASTIKANIRNGVSVNDFDGPGADSILYRNHAAHILSHTMEDVYRIQVSICGNSRSLLLLL